MPYELYRPRISIDVPQDLFDRVQRAFPWGTRNPTLITVLEQIVNAIETEGQVVAYLIINKKLKAFSGGLTNGLENSG